MRVGRSGQAVVLALSLMAGACSAAGGPRGAGPTSPASTATTAAAGGTTVASSGAAGGTVDWRPCSGGAGPAKYQCATIQVPRDPRHPGTGGTVGLALDRHPASGARIGSLLVNPGGPGASGVDFLPQVVGFLPKSVLKRFDVVGFDPPGVGRSAPVTCLDGPGLDRYFHSDPDPQTPAVLDQVVAEDRTFAQGCLAHSGAELPYVSTVDAAMDMDYIRRAVGDTRLNYFGFSYGTLLGATYAGLYPTRIRAMVLDGAIDPSLPVVRSLDDQSAAFDADLRAALGACRSDPSCPWKPSGDPVAAFEQLVGQVRVHPLPAKGTTRTVGPAELLYGTAATLYSTPSWPDLYDALAQIQRGNGTGMLALFDYYTGRNRDGSFSNEFEANAAVNCLDAAAPPIATIQSGIPAARSLAPVFGAADLYSELGCDVWPVPATGSPGPIRAAGSPPIVVVGSTGDPATPYAEAQALAGQLAQGVLLTRVGNGHTGYAFSQCIRNYVDAYLLDLTVPPAGVRCQSD